MGWVRFGCSEATRASEIGANEQMAGDGQLRTCPLPIGNSLAYRAFFALPESIATSTGVPTNAIFGFASMLVKILTDYGPKATVVVWDAGSSGRKEVYSEYKAQRSSRPDLLREQWPHLEPLVDAFGYRNQGSTATRPTT